MNVCKISKVCFNRRNYVLKLFATSNLDLVYYVYDFSEYSIKLTLTAKTGIYIGPLERGSLSLKLVWYEVTLMRKDFRVKTKKNVLRRLQ